jgi:hypothetical protein
MPSSHRHRSGGPRLDITAPPLDLSGLGSTRAGRVPGSFFTALLFPTVVPSRSPLGRNVWRVNVSKRKDGSFRYDGRWRNVRARVIERDGGVCQLRYPGCRGTADEVDHVVGSMARRSRRARDGLLWSPRRGDSPARPQGSVARGLAAP